MPKDSRKSDPKGDSAGEGHIDPGGDLDVKAADSSLVDDARQALEFEGILTEIFARFVSALPDGVDEVITWSLGRVCEFLGGERGGTLLFSPDKDKLTLTHQWSADGVETRLEPGEGVPAFKLDWVIDRLRRGEMVVVGDRDELPADAVVYLTFLEELGFRSTVSVPLRAGKSLAGVFGFGSETVKTDWSHSIVQRLQLVGKVFSDALSRKRTEEEIRIAEERFRIVAHSVTDLIFDLDVASGAAETFGDFDHVLGYEPGERENNLAWWEENLHPEDRERAMGILRHSLETGEENDYEVRVRTKQGDYRHWAIRSTPVLDESGKAVKLIGGVDDVTESWNTKEALRRTGELHRTILDSFPEEVVVLDANGVILAVNDEWERFATENDVSSLNAVRPGVNYLDACRALGGDEDELAEKAGEGIRAILRGDRIDFTMEYPCHSPSARSWFLLHAVPLRKEGGGAVVFHVNITEQKRSEEDLREAYAVIKSLKDRLEHENLYLREQADVRHDHEHIVGRSDAIKRTLRKVEQVAGTEASVLIHGETGTGKELIASAIHSLSRRRKHTMVKVNCGALPANLIENELFGREKGAYTGADSRHEGRFELADRSTLFLDEVGELPLELQAKLLRVLQDGEFQRLGSTKTIKVDVRIIVATNRDLRKEIEAGRFREDLYYRLNVFPIDVPPLRERVEDVPFLVKAFVEEFSEKIGRSIEAISRTDLEALQRYPWPGNIRELRNVIERAMILCDGDKPTLRIEVPDIRDAAQARTMTLEEMERSYITGVLEASGWRIRGKNGAADTLGLNEATLRSRMKKLGIQKPG